MHTVTISSSAESAADMRQVINLTINQCLPLHKRILFLSYKISLRTSLDHSTKIEHQVHITVCGAQSLTEVFTSELFHEEIQK